MKANMHHVFPLICMKYDVKGIIAIIGLNDIEVDDSYILIAAY